jgi:hypothetical protein
MTEEPWIRIIKLYYYTQLYYLSFKIFITIGKQIKRFYDMINQHEDPVVRTILLDLFGSIIVCAVLFTCMIHAFWMVQFLYKLYVLMGIILIYKILQ